MTGTIKNEPARRWVSGSTAGYKPAWACPPLETRLKQHCSLENMFSDRCGITTPPIFALPLSKLTGPPEFRVYPPRRYAAALSRRKISLFVVDVETSGSVRSCDVDFDFPPFPVTHSLLRSVCKHILLSQLPADLGCHFWHFLAVIGRQCVATCQLGDCRQQPLPELFLNRLEHRHGHVVEDSNGVHQHIGFFRHVPDFLGVIVAVIVAAVRDDKQRPPLVARLIHLSNAHINPVEQRGTAGWNHLRQSSLKVFA